MTYADYKAEMQRQRAISDAARNERVVTAVLVARDWSIERNGDNRSAEQHVVGYIHGWLLRNGAERRPQMDAVEDLVDAVWGLAALDDGVDPLTLVDDDFHGTSSDARDHLRNRYEQDVQDALNRITWKDR